MHLWRKQRTITIIERCFVEVRRRTRPNGLLYERQERRSNYLLHLPALWNGKPAPSGFYTSSLTSPRPAARNLRYC